MGRISIIQESTEPTIESKIASFDGVTCRYTKGFGHQYVKRGVCVLANFSKTTEQKKTPLSQFLARLEIPIILQKWTQSVYSSRSYSKNKVPYQMTIEERSITFRAQTEHLNIWKRYIKYIYSESTLDGLFKTLILSPEVTKFKASSWSRMVSTASGAKTEGKFTGQFL